MKNPTHAIYFKDNSQGDGDLIWLFACLIGSDFYHFESGDLLIQYEGDEILNSVPLNKAAN